MKKKALSLALALVMCLGLTVPAFAADNDFGIFPSGELYRYTGPGGDVVIPNGVTRIDMYAFSGCHDLTSVTIPEGVKSIGFGVFASCDNLTSVTLPNSLESIASYVFDGCSSLTSITLPSGVTSLGIGAFRGCTNLTGIYLDAGNQTFASVDGILFSKDMTSVEVCPIGNRKGAYVIPSGVTSIGDYAFNECNGLTDVTIPSGVVRIGKGAFEFCRNLASITIPNSVTSIEGSAFEECTSLKDVYYSGNKAQWQAIQIESDYSYYFPNSDITVHYNSTQPVEPEKPVKKLAKAADQNIEIDGKPVAFQTYVLHGTNYVKLRDIAHVLNGTAAQFSVGYDSKAKSISATPGAAYQDTGTEMDTPFAGANKEYKQKNLTVIVNGSPVELDALSMKDDSGNGYTYFKLRDLGSALGFKVDYTKERGVFIETK